MHIAPHDNQNKPIVDIDNPTVPLNYFNIVKLKKGEAFHYQVPGYETCIVPATGTVTVEVEGITYDKLGNRGEDVWDGEPEGVYIPVGAKVTIICTSDETETFIAGAKYDEVLEPFDVRVDGIDLVQYGSDDTKTHRKIKHILGQKQHGKVGRLLVSELFTVGQGGWSGFPATSTTLTVCRMKPGTTRPTTSASGRNTARCPDPSARRGCSRRSLSVDGRLDLHD
jgi:5-deoxy-glucuronate isomerase